MQHIIHCCLIGAMMKSYSILFPSPVSSHNVRSDHFFVNLNLFCKMLFVLLSQVAGIKGMFLANKRTDNLVKTHITYNRGRDWRLLQAPSKDLRGNSIHCILVSVCMPACRHAAFIHVLISVHFHQRAALTGADCSQQRREAELRKSSARQS